MILGKPDTIYQSFQEQLEDDQEMKKLGMMYGIANESQKKEIEERLTKIFSDYGTNYVKSAILFIKFIGSLTEIQQTLKKLKEEEGN